MGGTTYVLLFCCGMRIQVSFELASIVSAELLIRKATVPLAGVCASTGSASFPALPVIPGDKERKGKKKRQNYEDDT